MDNKTLEILQYRKGFWIFMSGGCFGIFVGGMIVGGNLSHLLESARNNFGYTSGWGQVVVFTIFALILAFVMVKSVNPKPPKKHERKSYIQSKGRGLRGVPSSDSYRPDPEDPSTWEQR